MGAASDQERMSGGEPLWRSGRCRSLGLAALLCGTALAGLPASAPAQEAATAEDPILLQTVVIEGEGESAIGPDETIVAERSTTGSKTDTPIVDIPAAVSVVTEAEMERRGVQDLDEALAYTPSVSTDIYGSDDRYDHYLIRGFYETGMGTYRDGLPVRVWNFTGSRMEPYGIQRFEVLKGSTSTLFGLNAPGGLVNAITKRPRDETSGEVYTTFGDGHVEAGTDFGGPIDAEGKWSYRITAKGQKGDNGEDYTRDDRIYVAPALTWSPTDATSLTLLADYYRRDGNTSHGIIDGSGISPDTFLGEPDFDKMDTEQTDIGYQFSHDFGGGLQFRSNARYTDLDLTYESVYPGAASTPPVIGREALAIDGHSESVLIDNQLQYDASFGMVDTRTLIGADYSWYGITESRVDATAGTIDIYDPDYCGRACVTPYRQLDDDTEYSIYGLYLQEELTIADRIIVTAGARYDHVEQKNDYHYDYGVWGISEGTDEATDEAVTGRLGLTFKATDEVSLYANYAESFQPIGASRAYLVEPAKPQEGVQYEVGAKFAPAGMNALFSLALFDLTQSNVAQWNATYTGQYQVGRINVRGVELEGKMALTDRFNLVLAYSYWDAEIEEDVLGNEGNRPQLVPEHIASVWGDYTIPGRDRFGDLTLGLGARFVGSTYADNANTVEIDSRTLLDAAASYQITDHASLAVNATNLLDEEYVSHVDTYSNTAYYGDGRTVRATLKYSW